MNYSYPQPLITFLYATRRSLQPREIRLGLAAQGVRLTDHEIVANLRHLLKEGLVSHDKGRWQAELKKSESPAVENSIQTFHSFPNISEETRSLLTSPRSSFTRPTKPSVSPHHSDSDGGNHITSGPWSNFRALVDYYRDCIRNDGRAEANALLNDLNDKFLFLSACGKTLPRPGQLWSICIPLGEHLSRLVQRIGAQGEDSLLILGYPLQVVYVCKEGEPDLHLLKPIFYLPVSCVLERGALRAQSEGAAYQVNLDWLQHTFNTPDKRRSFLSACGFFANETEDDATSVQLSNYSSPSIEHLAATLAAFCAHRLAEPLLTEEVSRHPLHQPLATGVYNRAVLMVASRPQYTKTLLRELIHIRDMPDSELDKTALRFLFREKTKAVQPDIVTSKVQVADTISLNDGQRHAADYLLNEPLSVITGPPGTGKSQVVSAVITNAYLYDRSVLFASRNHKAIDAVYERCRDSQERPLLTRCNSREDPSMRITFPKAIKQLLEGTSDQTATSLAVRLLEDLLPLLVDRQEKLRLAKQHEDWQERIGRLEQQLSYLEGSLPPKCINALASTPQKFPVRPLQVIAEAVSHVRQILVSHSMNSWLGVCRT